MKTNDYKTIHSTIKFNFLQPTDALATLETRLIDHNDELSTMICRNKLN